MSNVTKVPSAALADHLAAVSDQGSELLMPFLAFASEARQVLTQFDAEVDAAGLDEEQLQEAAAPLGALHDAIYEMSDGLLDLLIALGAGEQREVPKAAA